MDKALADLIKISNVTGKDSTLIQGGGGNTSVKTPDGKYMYIKASGTDLKDMDRQTGWRKLRLAPVLAIIKDKSIAKLNIQRRENEVVNRLLLACDDKVTNDARPSIEAHLHAFLGKCVIHLHPVAVLSFACAKTAEPSLRNSSKISNFPRPLFGSLMHTPALHSQGKLQNWLLIIKIDSAESPPSFSCKSMAFSFQLIAPMPLYGCYARS